MKIRVFFRKIEMVTYRHLPPALSRNVRVCSPRYRHERRDGTLFAPVGALWGGVGPTGRQAGGGSRRVAKMARGMSHSMYHIPTSIVQCGFRNICAVQSERAIHAAGVAERARQKWYESAQVPYPPSKTAPTQCEAGRRVVVARRWWRAGSGR